MMDNKEENRTNFCLWQAQAFIDYISKIEIKNKDELLETLRHWSDSKQFLEEDIKYIQNLVEQHWDEKEKHIAESKHQKHHGKNKFIEIDKKQLQFEFLDSPSNENGKEKEEIA